MHSGVSGMTTPDTNPITNTDMNSNILLASLPAADAARIADALEKRGIAASLADTAVSGLKAVTVPLHQALRASQMLRTDLVSGDRGAERSNASDTGILIPVDFSEKSLTACRVGFELAERLSSRPVLLHTYTLPYIDSSFVKADYIEGEDEVDGIFPSDKIRASEASALKAFEVKLRERQKEGCLPCGLFSSELLPGVPEDVIKEYSRVKSPKMIVMATRSRHRKEEEMIGSVTAEVLDSCRVPLFTVPEGCQFRSIREIRRLAFFCNLDSHDAASLESLLSLFDYPEVEITLIPVSDKPLSAVDARCETLLGSLRDKYPSVNFSMHSIAQASFKEDFRTFADHARLELLIVQNKKKNIFARLLNPGIAHILFYDREMPMIVIPV